MLGILKPKINTNIERDLKYWPNSQLHNTFSVSFHKRGNSAPKGNHVELYLTSVLPPFVLYALKVQFILHKLDDNPV